LKVIPGVVSGKTHLLHLFTSWILIGKSIFFMIGFYEEFDEIAIDGCEFFVIFHADLFTQGCLLEI
jgi:hypothetical protein